MRERARKTGVSSNIGSTPKVLRKLWRSPLETLNLQVGVMVLYSIDFEFKVFELRDLLGFVLVNGYEDF